MAEKRHHMVSTPGTPEELIRCRAQERGISIPQLIEMTGIPKKTFYRRLHDGDWCAWQLKRIRQHIELDGGDLEFIIDSAA